MRVDVKLLGPVELHSDGQAVALGSAKRRALLAGLALDANQPVPLHRLAELAWAGPPPQSVVPNLRNHAAALRRVLGHRIVSRAGGYQLTLSPDELDVTAFRQLTAEGRTALAAGRIDVAARRLTAALGLWRGPAGDDLPRGTALDAVLAGVDEDRLHAVEDLTEARLAGGEHSELVGGLRRHLDRHPLRERAWGQLMIALYRSGDPAASLNAYRDARAVLTAQLGMEPGPELVDLHRAVLDRAPELTAPRTGLTVRESAGEARPTGPRELPADLVSFVGRTREVAAVVAAVRDAAPPAPAAVVVCGAGGSGKSTLAVRAAHLLAADFPDGQVWIDLADQPTVPAGEVLARALRSLGLLDAEMPVRVDERAGRYRSMVACRRVLVVVDGVSSPAQVRPLVPAAPGPGLIVIGRRRLASLDGVRRVPVSGLSATDARSLLGALVGAEQLAADPAGAAELIRLCDGSPLALRIAGARLAARPDWPIRMLVEQLTDPGHRLDSLVYGDLSVRDSLATGYELVRASDELAARTFRLLGELPGPTAGAEETAVHLGVSRQRAWRALEELVDVHLADPVGPGHYRLPELAREYAGEMAARPVGRSRRSLSPC
ncbi:BTAD domain-containing putative transcriptional regulator [Micromonospora sp. CPCC 206060]|uniref:AfsR/SARP family transcriptional regulator n=1 Tax=Micromonospora sp. CPCC 206060 TaxID=3122406 RepID=UPI002FF38FEC